MNQELRLEVVIKTMDNFTKCFLDRNASERDSCFDEENFNLTAFLLSNPGHVQPDSLPSPWREIICFVYVIVIVVAAVGNSTVLLVICRNKKLQSVTYIFLFSLSLCTLLTALVIAPFTLWTYVAHEWVFGAVWCKGCSYIKALIIVCTILTLTVISLDR